MLGATMDCLEEKYRLTLNKLNTTQNFMNLKNNTPELAVNNQNIYALFNHEENDDTEEINKCFTEILQESA